MKIKLLFLFASGLYLAGCTKGGIGVINVSKIYTTNEQGQQIGSFPNDNQWKNQEFSKSEMKLFKDMDTADLSGAVMPAIGNHYYAYPNPFTNYTNFAAALNRPVSGWVVVKYVVVNRWKNPVQKAAHRVATNYGDIRYSIPANFKSGNYRVYFTYSAQGKEHFYKSRGNIKKL